MSYTNSKAFAGRGSKLQYSTNPPSVSYTELAELKSISISGAKYDLADITNMQSSNFREWLPTLADSGELSVAGNYIPNDATQSDLLGFFNNATLVTWEIVLPASAQQGFPTSLGMLTFKAYVSARDLSIPMDKEASVSIKLKITGAVTFTPGS